MPARGFHSPRVQKEMLEAIGVASFEDLLSPIPPAARYQGSLPIPPSDSEESLRRLYRDFATRNYDPERTVCFLGAGLYDHILPAAIHQLQIRSEFLTAYTPYQAEVAQGTLATIFEFQSIIAELTGLEVANAGLYDGGSAAAEAALLAVGSTGRNRILLSEGLHPHTREIVTTYCDGPGVEVETIALRNGVTDGDALERTLRDDVAALIVQSPNFFGCLEELEPSITAAHRKGALGIVVANLVTLGLLEPPAKFGADLAVGEAQCFGNPPSYGGPLAGFFAARRELVRRLPGRLVAEAEDAEGDRGYTLTLQTREQHIRRERATSNICTNNHLVALGATLYFSLLGPSGLTEVARQCLQKAHYLADRLIQLPGVGLAHPSPFFHEFALELPRPAREVIRTLMDQEQILAGFDLGRVRPEWEKRLLVAVTEKRTKSELDAYAEALGRALRGVDRS